MMRPTETKTIFKPRVERGRPILTDEESRAAMLKMLCGNTIPKCIHVRLMGAPVMVVHPELAYCFDCHDLFESWGARHAAA